MLNSKQQTTKKISCYFTIDKRHLSNDIKHFFSFQILHQIVNIFFIMIGLGEPYNIRKNYFWENSFLLNHTLFHWLFPNRLFWKTFNGIQTFHEPFIFYQINLTKLTLSKLFKVLKLRKIEHLNVLFIQRNVLFGIIF